MILYYGNGKIEFGEGELIRAFEIRYKGSFTAEADLPEGWYISHNSKKIIGFNLGNSNPDLLFNYIGNIFIYHCDAVGDDEIKKRLDIKLKEIDHPKYIKQSIEDITMRPEDMSGTYRTGNSLETNIVQINLSSKPNELFFKDGIEYSGDYHTHGNGQSMTGSKHTKESKNVYRKDKNEKLIMPKEKKGKVGNAKSYNTTTTY